MGWSNDVKTVTAAGPFCLQQPILLDSVNAAQRKFSKASLIDSKLPLSNIKNGTLLGVEALNADTTHRGALMLVGFSFDIDRYAGVQVKVHGPKEAKVFVNGKEAFGKKSYQRGHYNVVVKYVCDTAKLSLSVKADSGAVVSINEGQTAAESKHSFSMLDNMDMKYYSSLSVSPSGRYASVGVYGYEDDGVNRRQDKLFEIATGRVLMQQQTGFRWMPKSDRLLKVTFRNGRRVLLCVDPRDMSERILCPDMPAENYRLAPSEDYAVLTQYEQGPSKEKDVYEVLTPDDRQPGWRSRSYLSLLDLKTGLVQPLTYGYHSAWLNDISSDGSHIVFSVRRNLLNPLGSKDSLRETNTPPRPTELSSVLLYNLKTHKLDTLIRDDGFINDVLFVPGKEQLIIRGSAEALGGVGNILPAGATPNTYDYQLFLLDIPTRKVTPLTRDFNPSVASVKPSDKGDFVYFTANNADSVSLYRINLRDLKITYIEQPCEVVDNFDLSRDGNTLFYYGTSACVPATLYAYDVKKGKACVLDDANAERMQALEIGTCHPLCFQSQRGYTLTGHYYLPSHFDPAKKYPVIVHYYGGCTPTSRRFGGGAHYPAHYWNAMGYIVLVCNPSGASGFGAEWASRHVNTMGEGVAEDIIETVRHFSENPWVDAKKIGCISASYGGFMTQYLLTKTDLFAAGVSHAGISDHTSYWGDGYWGYTYSQVCAANSYPWTRKDLFVDRSPLYNADKIHTPLLFTHGTADTNVPINESIQMYTALKLLGRPTAFVMVEGENHGIMDYQKRQLWINTIVAWFDRWLKGDSSWWNAIYKPKDL